MLLSSALIFAAVVISAQAHGHGHHHGHSHHHGHQNLRFLGEETTDLADTHRKLTKRKTCGTKGHSPEKREESQKMMDTWLAEHGCKSDMECPYTDRRRRGSENLINVDAHWHIITKTDGTGTLTTEMISNAMANLNAGFAAVGFSFTLVNTDTTANDAWYDDLNNQDFLDDMTGALRQGDCSTLNIFSMNEAEFAGFSFQTPEECAGGNQATDGISIAVTEIAGFPGAADDVVGDLLIHEVGHWLGLEHPWDGGCSGTDFVSDTPQMAQEQTGDDCPVEGTVDSCPDQPGFDLHNNYMDYLSDSCVDSFTPGQITRMLAQGETFRNLKGSPSPTAPTDPGPAPAPTPTSPPTSCFSSVATASVKNKGRTEMPDLQVGDHVLTANGYKPLFALAHDDETTPEDFIRITTDAGNSVELSPNHMVFLADKDQDYAVPASSIKPGDTLCSAEPREGAVVQHIDRVSRPGLFAPLSTDGTIFVDGILSSCYVVLQPKGKVYIELEGGISTGLTQHFVAHLAMTPARLACLGISPAPCQTYDAAGLAHFAKLGFALAEFADSQIMPVQIVLLGLFLAVFGSLYAVESLFGPKLAVWVMALAFGCFVVRLSNAHGHGNKLQKADKRKTE